MWPFAKLLNGFGSHRYLYSPILFDSQGQNANSFANGIFVSWCNLPTNLTTCASEGRGKRWRWRSTTLLVSCTSCRVIYTTYWRVSAVMEVMENGECSPECQPTLPGTLEWSKTYLHYAGSARRWRWRWSSAKLKVTEDRGSLP